MGDEECTSIIEHRMSELARELVRITSRRNWKRRHTESETEEPKLFLDPPMPTHHSNQSKRYKDNDPKGDTGNLKKNQGCKKSGKGTPYIHIIYLCWFVIF